MYNVFKDSLLFPKNILLYRNKSGWYITLYLLLLTLLVSLGQIIFLINLREEVNFNEVTEYCTYVDSHLQCGGEDYRANQSYSFYGYTVYFIDDSIDPATVIDASGKSLVFYKDNLVFYWDLQQVSVIDVRPIIATGNLSEVIGLIGSILFGMSIVIFFFTNLLLLLFVTFISTIPFFRLKKFIPYKKIFKLVALAITPFAVLMTFYHLIHFPDIIFYLLMIVAYRSVFVLHRELQIQTFQYFMKTQSHDSTSDSSSMSEPEEEDSTASHDDDDSTDSD